MYESFFGLHAKPFDLTPNPAFLYMSPAHRKAFNYLCYGIRQQSGFILLTGEVGTGKTTLVRGLIKSQLGDVSLSKVFNTKIHSRQLLEMILEDFGVRPAGKDKPSLLRELNDFLIDQYAQGRDCVLIIDEAQNLSRELLEEVRMLSNLESDSRKLLRIILVGQPELSRLLASPDLLQLRQRIQVSCHIHPLPEDEVGAYVAHRLEAAGNREAALFAPGTFEAVARHTRGVPRLINILCDYLFLDAFANQSRDITPQSVDEVARDLDFENHYWNPVQPDSPVQSAPGCHKTPGHSQAKAQARASVTISSLLKNLNGRLKSIEEALPRLESASRGAPGSANGPESQALNARLEELRSTIGGRLDDMWKTVDQMAREVHELKQGMEGLAVGGYATLAGSAARADGPVEPAWPEALDASEAPEQGRAEARADGPVEPAWPGASAASAAGFADTRPGSLPAGQPDTSAPEHEIPAPRNGWWRRLLHGTT